ncbi:MAG: DUF4738 domain-containing protein [Bacteroides sp.]|nr:DUF4738 domain-containing protein [Bacteroides sp.]
MRKTLSLIALVLLICSCTGKPAGESPSQQESTAAKELLQGVWLDEFTDSPVLRIAGDTIYYNNSQNIPVYFQVIKDSLYMHGGNRTVRYKIDRHTEHVLWFHSLPDHVIKLYKSENAEDTLAFVRQRVEVIRPVSEVMKKDTVVTYDGVRYRAYAYINPSSMKVVRSRQSEDGLSYENVYYDNVIHICVYQGAKSLFAKDITKEMFEEVIAGDVLQRSILADMEFNGVNRSGYHYQAMVCIPESPVCNLVNLDISFDGELFINPAE